MNEEEFQELERLLREQFETIGVPELGDERAYAIREGLEGTPRFPDARERVIQMLMALDRYLAIQDGRTYHQSLAAIRQVTEGTAPERVIVEPIRRGTEVSPDLDFAVSLSNAPDLSAVRQSINQLIHELRETPYST